MASLPEVRPLCGKYAAGYLILHIVSGVTRVGVPVPYFMVPPLPISTYSVINGRITDNQDI